MITHLLYVGSCRMVKHLRIADLNQLEGRHVNELHVRICKEYTLKISAH